MQVTSVCFTSFENSAPIFDESKMTYMIYQKEKCPKTNKEHWQGYCEFKTKQRFTAIKKILGDSVHLEQRRGTQKEAIEYCSKEDTRVSEPVIHGVPKNSKQGKRTDLEKVSDMIANKKSIRDIAMKHTPTFIKYHKGIEQANNIINYEDRDPEKPPTVVWIYGSSGTGKSRYVWDTYKKEDIYVKDPESKWWDGYTQQLVILIDDYKDAWRLEYLLTVIDRYPKRVEVKGGYIALNSPIIIITSIKKPNEPEVKRRVCKFLNMDKKDNYDEQFIDIVDDDF